jgi:hypothetical protein
MLALIAAGIAGLLVAHEQAPAGAANLMLIYVGADDCAPCRAWQRDDGKTFRHSKDFAQFCYREVKAGHLREILDDKHWPEDIRPYRSLLRLSDGVPLWFVVTDNTAISQYYGVAAWKDQVLPRLRKFSQRSGRGAGVHGAARLDAITCDKTSEHRHIVDHDIG